jgi:dihydrofolate reductase
MVKLIVAKSARNIIGKDNDLIWHLPADMRFFTESTRGHIVIMGRRNWDSIPLKYRPLSDRLNIVVSRKEDYAEDGCEHYTSIEEAINAYKDDNRDIYIIGGGQIYDYALKHNLVNEMLITKIDHDFEGDTVFPEFDKSEWDESLFLDHPIDEKNKYPFKIWKYIKR